MKKRAVRLVRVDELEYGSLCDTTCSVAETVGCHPEALLEHVAADTSDAYAPAHGRPLRAT